VIPLWFHAETLGWNDQFLTRGPARGQWRGATRRPMPKPHMAPSRPTGMAGRRNCRISFGVPVSTEAQDGSA
jgi:hypothetical protein